MQGGETTSEHALLLRKDSPIAELLFEDIEFLHILVNSVLKKICNFNRSSYELFHIYLHHFTPHGKI